MQFGMPTLIENRTLEDNIALCKNLGLRFIELNMNFPEYQTDRLEQTDLLLRAAEQAGIYYTIHLDENLNIADFNRLVSDAYLETVRRTVDVAKKFLCLRERFKEKPHMISVQFEAWIMSLFTRIISILIKSQHKYRSWFYDSVHSLIIFEG